MKGGAPSFKADPEDVSMEEEEATKEPKVTEVADDLD